MSAVEFVPFEKIARLNRNITITEKIDGTNAAVVIVPIEEMDRIIAEDGTTTLGFFGTDNEHYLAVAHGHVVFAQSRNRFVATANDNYGFAGWVQRNAGPLVLALGAGRHYGEWWGSGIQSKYGLSGGDKRFSLFNTKRWGDPDFDDLSAGFERVPGLGVVPVLYEGPFDEGWINGTLDTLREHGSVAQPGFMKPEGIVVYHHALRSSFKVTLEGDEAPKGAAGHALDEERKAA